jgi:hypothetical protein
MKDTDKMAYEILDSYLKIYDFPDIKASMHKIICLYLTKEIQEECFPGYGFAAIQTCIRECLYEYLNPLPIFKPEKFTTCHIRQTHLTVVTDFISRLPHDLHQYQLSFLNAQSIFAYKQTCKSAYFMQKKYQDQAQNLLYVIGQPVQISGPRSGFISDAMLNLRKNIPDNEIIASITDPSIHKVIAFRSLYQAIEYIQYKKIGDNFTDDEDAYLPSLWLAAYSGDVNKLTFCQENIVLNKGSSGCGYDYSHRDICISRTVITKNSISPIVGAVIYPEKFSGYRRNFTPVDFKLYIKNSSHHEDAETEATNTKKKERCSLM